ncbi:glycosyltransferase family 4 protein [Vibrio chagasii]|uniref:glycosyltransferase family 4 protein n=1 Tax=Vibrio chagasii TaxID=170679 RepID=UPI001640D5BC|nr:glycosyltransferase [Vibrio chagasii]
MKIINISPLWFHKGDGITEVVINHHVNFIKHKVESLLLQTNVKVASKKEILNQALYNKSRSGINEAVSLHFFLREIYKNRNEKFIVHGLFQLRIIFSLLLLSLLNCNFIVFPHSSLSCAAFEKSGKIKYLVYNCLLKYILRRAIKVIYLNSEEKKNSIYKNSNSTIVPNGVDVESVCLKNNFTNKSGTVNFCFLGRYDIQHKGLDRLIGLFETLESKYDIDWTLNLYGSDAKGDRPILEKLVNKSIIKSKIKFNDAVFDSDKWSVLGSADIFVLTSRYEGMPIAVLEAISLGKMCLLSPETNMLTQLKKKGLCIEYKLNNLDSTCDELLEYINLSFDAKKRLSETTLSYAKENYSWSEIVLKIIKELNVSDEILLH